MDIPWWTPDATKFVDSILSKNFKVLEFGCGGSTIWLSHRVNKVISIEHNKKWLTKIENLKLKNVELKLVPRPYNAICNEFENESFDFIIVDGRDRVLCFNSAIKLLKKDCWICLDDAQRERYNDIKKLVSSWECMQTINLTDKKFPPATWFWRKPK